MRILQLLVVLALLCPAIPARSQQALAPAALPSPAASPAFAWDRWGTPESRWLFPHHWLRGYTDFEFVPSKNEPDLGRCSVLVRTGIYGGADTQCTAYARYMASGYLEIQPFGRTLLRHLILFWMPRFSFGSNVPQYSYTASIAPMAYERSIGLAVELPKHLEFRATQHAVDWLGKYRGDLGPADLHTYGPYGLYATVGVRWYFGGYGPSQEP